MQNNFPLGLGNGGRGIHKKKTTTIITTKCDKRKGGQKKINKQQSIINNQRERKKKEKELGPRQQTLVLEITRLTPVWPGEILAWNFLLS